MTGLSDADRIAKIARIKAIKIGIIQLFTGRLMS
jgi:hypothetical protein